VCFFTFAREAAGALGTRLSLRPLFLGDNVGAQLGRYLRRESAHVSLVIASASEAIHSFFTPQRGLLRGACHLCASAIALVGGAHSRDPLARNDGLAV
jgi:hypothetical protein